MKKIVIVDDRPWQMRDSISALKSKGVIFFKTIYYPNDELSQEEQNELIAEYQEQTGMETVWVDSERKFMDEMEKVYGRSDIIFLMDYDLKGDMNRDTFFKRINVRYAIAKDKENKKIWFYTTGPADIKGLLIDTFPERMISVTKPDVESSYWDEAQVLAAVSQGE